MHTHMTVVVAENVRAVNAHDLDAMVATFADDARVNDAGRHIDGINAIRCWARKEIIGDRVTIEPREVTERYGDTIVTAKYDGRYDKTNLPGELIMTNYYTVVDDKIVGLIVIKNRPSEY